MAPSNAEQVTSAARLVQRRPSASLQRAKQGREAQFDEIGTTGLRHYGGWVQEEWLRELQGRKGAWAYREMADNSPIVGAILYAVEMLARKVDYRVEDGKPEHAEFVESCMHDMSHTWGDFISEALSFLPYGWALHEEVFKRRQGEQPDTPGANGDEASTTEEDDRDAASSKYNDGKIGWRKLPIRAQETLLKWDFEGYAGLKAMHQVDWHGGNHIVPISKALLFRTKTARGNPEGYSILRKAWTSYYAVKNIQAIEAIGIERDLAGIPVAKAPEGLDIFSVANKDIFQAVQEMVTTIRRDEDEGIVLPTGWELELLSTGGSRQIDTDAVIRRYEQRIASSVLADFILLGQDAVGSYAMVDVKSEMFGLAMDGILDLICEVLNRYAIPRLLRLNGMVADELPRIDHSSSGRIDLEKVGNFLYQLSGAGAPIPWSKELIEQLFGEAGLPASFDTAIETEQEPTGSVHRLAADDETPANQPTQLEKGDLSVIHDVGSCARCGEDHTHLSFRRLASPVAGEPDFSYWATCPTTGEPILLGYGDQLSKAETSEEQAAEQERELATTVATAPAGAYGTALMVAPLLSARMTFLSLHLEKEILSALAQLGIVAATAYLSLAGSKRLSRKRARQQLASQVTKQIGLKEWLDQRLEPILRNQAVKVVQDTERIVSQQAREAVKVPEIVIRRLTDKASRALRLKPDLERGVKEAIMRAIDEVLDAGENPNITAKRIENLVPAGRWVNAGPAYRARLIARNETAEMQHIAAIAAYKQMSNITALRLHDGIYGPPRSDAQCMARDGEIVPIGGADRVKPNHPLCTLGVSPVVSTLPPAPDTAPVLVAA